MSPDEERILAQDAESVLNNKAYKVAIEKIKQSLERRELGCNTSKEPDLAADIIRCKQLMAGIERELQNLISNGEVAKLQLVELDKKRLFNRGF